MARFASAWAVLRLAAAVTLLATGTAADNILETSGFTICKDNNDLKVQKVDLKYNSSNKTIIFDVAGSSASEQNVTAVLEVKAYGNDIYSQKVDPCRDETFVEQLCPVPQGDFAAKGKLPIPDEYASMVPAIAFQIPDIAAFATLKLLSADGEEIACIKSQVSNGKTVNVPARSTRTERTRCVSTPRFGRKSPDNGLYDRTFSNEPP
jgi:hypothetical protein